MVSFRVSELGPDKRTGAPQQGTVLAPVFCEVQCEESFGTVVGELLGCVERVPQLTVERAGRP